jgi:hypothetical protein
MLDAGENPPSGAIVHYWLKDVPAGELTLTFLDDAGKEIRSFTSKAAPKPGASMVSPAPAAEAGEDAPAPAAGEDEPRPTKQAGANRFVWDLRGPNATKIPDNKGRGGTMDSLTAPRVGPGQYQVRLTVGGNTYTQPFEVVKDPRVAATDADLREQYALARKSHELLTRTHDAILKLRGVRAQAEAWAKRAPAVKDAAQAVVTALNTIEDELLTVKSDDPRMFPAKLNTRLATVVTLIEYSDAKPTASLRDLCENLTLRAEMELAKLDRCLNEDVAAFNARCREAGVAAIVP